MTHCLHSLAVKARLCFAASCAPALLAALLFLASCGGGSGAVVPVSKSKVLMIDASTIVQGVQVNVSRKDFSPLTINNLQIDTNLIGTGADSQVITREISLGSDAKSSFTLAAYSLTGPGNATIRLFSVSMDLFDVIEIKNIRCAGNAGNPVSCKIRWENVDG